MLFTPYSSRRALVWEDFLMRQLSIPVVVTAVLLAGLPAWAPGAQERFDPPKPAAGTATSNEQRLREDLERALKALKAEQERRLALQKQFQGLTNQTQQQAARIANLEAGNQKWAALLDKERGESRAAVEDLRQALEKADKLNEQLRRELSKAQGQVGTVTGERDHWRNQARSNEKDLGETRQRLLDTERRMADANRRIDNLARDLANTSQALAEAMEQRWLWAVIAAVLALAIGSLLMRWAWRKGVPKPVSVSVNLGEWNFARASEAPSGTANIALRAVVLPVRAEIRGAERLVA